MNDELGDDLGDETGEGRKNIFYSTIREAIQAASKGCRIIGRPIPDQLVQIAILNRVGISASLYREPCASTWRLQYSPWAKHTLGQQKFAMLTSAVGLLKCQFMDWSSTIVSHSGHTKRAALRNRPPKSPDCSILRG